MAVFEQPVTGHDMNGTGKDDLWRAHFHRRLEQIGVHRDVFVHQGLRLARPLGGMIREVHDGIDPGQQSVGGFAVEQVDDPNRVGAPLFVGAVNRGDLEAGIGQMIGDQGSDCTGGSGYDNVHDEWMERGIAPLCVQSDS